MSKKSTVVALLILFSGFLGAEMLYAQPAGGPLRDLQGNPLPAEASLETLVPGFDVIEDVIPVPGFGAKAEYLNVPVQEADFTEAEQTIKRYDRNRNGVLEADEIRKPRRFVEEHVKARFDRVRQSALHTASGGESLLQSTRRRA